MQEPSSMGAVMIIFAVVSSFYAIYRMGRGIVISTAWYLNWKRERLDHSAIEAAIEVICDDIIQSTNRGEQSWHVRPASDKYDNTSQEIWRKDRKVKIRSFKDWGWISVDIGGVGKYSRDELKPSVRKRLSRICSQLQQHTAVERILNDNSSPEVRDQLRIRG